MTATTTYGRDMSCVRFARRGSIVTGGRLLGEAAYRRLSTERGRLLYARGYGLGLQRMLNSVQSDSDLASWPGQIRAELLKDKRLDTVSVEVASELISGTSRRVTVTIEGFAKNGVDGFGLVLSVDEVSVRLLQLRA